MEVEEPMDIDASADFDKFDDVLEEGEYVESNRVSRKNVPSPSTILGPESKIQNKAGAFITGVDIFSKEARERMEERAKRFGISKEKEKFSLQDIENLYDSFGIVEGSENAKNYRLNVLHMRGVERMNTKDIFQYFENYAPASIEWIDDISCNVVWLDKASSARAILGLSKRIVGTRKGNFKSYTDEEDSDEDLIIVNGNKNHKEEKNVLHVRNLRCPLPPGIWRKGQDYLDSRSIFLRFATVSDRKLPFDEKIYLKGILRTSRKRPHKQFDDSLVTPKKESDTNGIAKKNPWGLLSENWGVTDFVEDDYLPKRPPSVLIEPVSNVRERLGTKAPRVSREVEDSEPDIDLSEESESESSSGEENWCKRSKVPRMRMHADDEEEKIQKRKGKIRTMASSQILPIKSHDLRKRLSARRRLPLKSLATLPSSLPPGYGEDIQVIVTNPKAIRSNFQNLGVTEDEDDERGAIKHDDDDDNDEEEEEEGEIVDSDSDSDSKVNLEDGNYEDDDDDDSDDNDDDDEDVEAGSESELQSESDDSTSDSAISEKEIQGPKGSVIKVVPRKPKLASTVSTVRTKTNNLNKKEINKKLVDSFRPKNDLRLTLGKRKSDLRSRIGNHHIRGRSPLRIELRNDKYSGKKSDSE